MYSGALADPEYLRMVAPQFVLRKKVANLCVRLRASEAKQMNALLQTVGLVVVLVIILEYQLTVLGKVASDLGEGLLPPTDGPLSSSELGEYPTYKIRLSRRY